LTGKLPVILIPCGHIICKECFSNISTNPQDKGSAVCPIDGDTIQNKDSMIIAKHLVDKMEKNFGHFLVCPNHQQRETSYLNFKEKTFLCKECAVNNIA